MKLSMSPYYNKSVVLLLQSGELEENQLFALESLEFQVLHEIPLGLSYQNYIESPKAFLNVILAVVDVVVIVQEEEEGNFVSDYRSLFVQAVEFSDLARLSAKVRQLVDKVHSLENLRERIPRPRGKEFESRDEYADCIAHLTEVRAANVLQDDPVFVLPMFSRSQLGQMTTVAELKSLMRLGLPFLVKGCESPIKSYEELVSVCGDHVVGVRKGADVNGYGGMQEGQVALKEYIRATRKGHNLENYYAANNMLPLSLAKKLSTPEKSLPFLSQFSHAFTPMDSKFWLGCKDAKAPLHRDLQDNWVWCLFGRKMFELIPPNGFCTWEKKPKRVTPFLQSAPGTTKEWETKLQRRIAVTVDMQSGDLLWLPTGWWHSTTNLADVTCTVNYWMSAIFLALGVALPNLGLVPKWSEIIDELDSQVDDD